MYAIMGITGQVGGAVARALLADSKPVRAIVRDTSKGRTWANRGCKVALANINDILSLSSAFQGVEGRASLFDSDVVAILNVKHTVNTNPHGGL